MMIDTAYIDDLKAMNRAEIEARQFEIQRIQREITELHNQAMAWFGQDYVMENALASLATMKNHNQGLFDRISLPLQPIQSQSNIISPRVPGWWETIGLAGIFSPLTKEQR